jgi:hypothetical protein
MRRSLLFVHGLMLALLILSLVAAPVGRVHAQADTWSDPVNLSNSAGTQAPAIVVDSAGVSHVLWEDIFASFMYSRGQGGQWSPPVPLDLPFYGQSYRLAADNRGFIHAVWLDDEGLLQDHLVNAENMSQQFGWPRATRVSADVINFDLTIDATGRAHVLFLRAATSANQPAGIYYTTAAPGSQSWSLPVLLYSSQYFRVLQDPSRVNESPLTIRPVASVDIESVVVDNTVHLLAAWDNPKLKRVFFAQSNNGGQAWQSPTQIAGPQPDLAYQNPSGVRLTANGTDWLITWQLGDPTSTCLQKFATSQDLGVTWSDSGDVFADFTLCPDRLQFFPRPGGDTLLFATIQSKVYIVAWNGQQWSPAREESSLRNFVDETTFNLVEYDCQQAAFAGDVLTVVGCDAGDGGDIWAASRAVQSLSGWFAPSSGWSEPQAISIDEERVSSLSAAVDTAGAFHVVWSQPGVNSNNQPIANLSYAQWNAEGVSGPNLVVNALKGIANPVHLAFAPPDRLAVVWSGGQSGEVTFAWANTTQAASRSSWSSPLLLQESGAAGSQPYIEVDEAGNLDVTFAVPVNEGRGIYFARSSDGGLTWSAAAQVFDGAAGGCESVGQPSLASTGPRSHSILWSCSTVPGGIGPLSLYAATSNDDGATWSQAQLVAATAVTWSRVKAVGALIHWVWAEAKGSQTYLWHAYSTDAGQTWSPAANISIQPGTANPTALTLDPAGRLHLVQAVAAGSGVQAVYYRWSANGWVQYQGPAVEADSLEDLSALDAAYSPQDQLMVVYSGLAPRQVDGSQQNQVVFTALPVEQAQALPPAESTPAAEQPNPAATQAVETAQPTVVSGPTLPTDPPASGSPWSGLILGAGVTLIVVAAALVINFSLKRPNRF